MAPPAVVRVKVKCTGTRKNGERCDHLLFRVDIERWEEALTDAVESKCEKCGTVYTLADYR